MQAKPADLKQARLPESAQIFDESDGEWVLAFRKDFKRQKTITLIDNITFDASTTSKNGNLFEVRPYSMALILVDLAVTDTPTDIVISLEFSHDRISWFKYMIDAWGDLRYEDAAGDKKESLDIPILAPYMRAKAVATGTDGTHKFTLNLTAVLNG